MSTDTLCFEKNVYTPVNSSFTIEKWGINSWGYITWTCSRDAMCVVRVV